MPDWTACPASLTVRCPLPPLTVLGTSELQVLMNALAGGLISVTTGHQLGRCILFRTTKWRPRPRHFLWANYWEACNLSCYPGERGKPAFTDHSPLAYVRPVGRSGWVGWAHPRHRCRAGSAEGPGRGWQGCWDEDQGRAGALTPVLLGLETKTPGNTPAALVGGLVGLQFLLHLFWGGAQGLAFLTNPALM